MADLKTLAGVPSHLVVKDLPEGEGRSHLQEEVLGLAQLFAELGEYKLGLDRTRDDQAGTMGG